MARIAELPGQSAQSLDAATLRSYRARINAFCGFHEQSVDAFRSATDPYFKLTMDEVGVEGQISHLTTTSTCLDSLSLAVSLRGSGLPRVEEGPDVDDLITQFAERALSLTPSKWKSEQGAEVYCRVRTLPLILERAPADIVVRHGSRVATLLRQVWRQVSSDPQHQGIAEQGIGPSSASGVGYPPNTYHTYWAIRSLQAAAAVPGLEKLSAEFDAEYHIAMLWARYAVTREVALHNAASPHADASQLGWGIACMLHDYDPPIAGTFSQPDLLKSALSALFLQQLESGVWPRGNPLFHYPRAGNAYAYSFETLAELLLPAIRSTMASELVRELLKPHAEDLTRAFDFAYETAIGLEGRGFGWCSQHHPHRVAAESWATAGVFSFAQALRCLVGLWSKEESERRLHVRKPRWSPDEGQKLLSERGNTWTWDGTTRVSTQLALLFVNAVRARDCRETAELVDPDAPLIDEDQARSAILFGPPGTSKTTLVEAVAASVSWNFVEVHASDFLSRGMDQVPSRADEIFGQLMELDHCVVIFDEIDELLRERAGQESDPFGRFLTTSMLPKVAKLWEQRRLLFFVATNDIGRVDPAIKRSQRFDTKIYVPTPAFEAKKAFLEKRLGIDMAFLTNDEVERALGTKEPLGFLALLRFDQLGELADALRPSMDGDDPVDINGLKVALEHLGHEISETDWHTPAGAKADHPFERFVAAKDMQSRDHRMARIVSATALPDGEVPRHCQQVAVGQGSTFLRIPGQWDVPPEELQTDHWTGIHSELGEYEPEAT